MGDKASVPSVDDGMDWELDFTSHTSSNFPTVLAGLKLSLAVTSYQAHKLFFVRSDGNKIDVNFKDFPRPMGLAVTPQQITLGTLHQVWRFRRSDDALALIEDSKVDACYVASASHTTGLVNIHDIAYGNKGLWITNSAFSCLATLEPDYSFVPRWKPPFISDLMPEDRCHLNGMAMLDGEPAYVTTFNQSDQAKSWRDGAKDKGTLIDVKTGELKLSNLVMPHSPRCYNGYVYFCESGHGLVRRYDPRTNEVVDVIKLQGFTRGMDFFGPLMFVGLSKTRNSSVAEPAPIAQESTESESGIWCINLTDHTVVGFVRFEGNIDQIYDVAVLPGVTYPELFLPDDEQSMTVFHFPPLQTAGHAKS
jgi:uncharacterized protein (TIGR03032 family)